MKELAGRVAVITGSGIGIGRATATALASEGGRVVVADMNLAGASETVERIAASGGHGPGDRSRYHAGRLL